MTEPISSIIDSIQLARDAYYQKPSETGWTMVAPLWMRPLICRDIAERTGLPMQAVTDDIIIAELKRTAVMPSAMPDKIEWVGDWQAESGAIQRDSAQVLFFPTDSFGHLPSGITGLDTVKYDEDTNQYRDLWKQDDD